MLSDTEVFSPAGGTPITFYSDTILQEYVFYLVGSRQRENICSSTMLPSFFSRGRGPTKEITQLNPKGRFSNNLPHFIISVLIAPQGPFFLGLVSEKACIIINTKKIKFNINHCKNQLF
jgi:hypothetical protein